MGLDYVDNGIKLGLLTSLFRLTLHLHLLVLIASVSRLSGSLHVRVWCVWEGF